MNKFLTHSIAVLVGLIVGGVAVNWKFIKNEYYGYRLEYYQDGDEIEEGAWSALITAVYWSKGLDDELGSYYQDTLPDRYMELLLLRGEASVDVQYYGWRLRKFYRENGLVVPEELQEYFEALSEERPPYSGSLAE